jgi:hypothetical protein
VPTLFLVLQERLVRRRRPQYHRARNEDTAKAKWAACKRARASAPDVPAQRPPKERVLVEHLPLLSADMDMRHEITMIVVAR